MRPTLAEYKLTDDGINNTARYRGLQAALLTLIVLLIAILIQLYAGDQVLTVARKHLHL